MEPHKSDHTVGEEASAFGQRTKGAIKDAAGAVTGNDRLEREGERENATGRARQAANNVMGDTPGARGTTPDGRITSSAGGYVTGLYSTPEDASKAYHDLTTRHGYKAGDVDVVMTDETRKRHFGDAKPGSELEGDTKAAEGMGVGGAIGGGVGAAVAAVFAVGTSIAIPGLGLVVAGPIAAALAGAGAGAATGGLIGALVGAGIPEDRAAAYERGLKDGGIVIGTRARDAAHASELENDFGRYGGTNVVR